VVLIGVAVIVFGIGVGIGVGRLLLPWGETSAVGRDRRGAHKRIGYRSPVQDVKGH